MCVLGVGCATLLYNVVMFDFGLAKMLSTAIF